MGLRVRTTVVNGSVASGQYGGLGDSANLFGQGAVQRPCRSSRLKREMRLTQSEVNVLDMIVT